MTLNPLLSESPAMAPPGGVNVARPINDPQPRLPPEMCERIIDRFNPRWSDDERRTLLNCALVCRGWYAHSRAVLFEEPQLRSQKQAISYARSLTRVPLLAARVRSLVVGPVEIATGSELASILVTLAGKLPNLASLRFFSVTFEHYSMRNLAFWSLNEFSHITSLWLHDVMLPSAGPLFQVICSFPRLQTLSCYKLRWSKPRSMTPLALPERHRMPLTTVTFLYYDLSCLEGIGHVLLGLLDQAVLKTLKLHSPVSAAALAFVQDILNKAGRRLEEASIIFRATETDAGSNFQSLLLHPISFETNANLQALDLKIYPSDMNDVALFVRSVLLPLLETISSKDFKDIHFYISSPSQSETDALFDAFDPEVCIQIDELLAEGYSAELRAVSIHYDLFRNALDDSQRVNFCAAICARFPKLNDKNVLRIWCSMHQFPNYAQRALKAKQSANKQPPPTEQAAA